MQIIEETYNFACTMCGHCCTGDQKVHLNHYDLFKMGRYFKFNNTNDLFKNDYLHLQLGQNGYWFPQIKFKTFRYNSRNQHHTFCPFLSNEFTNKMELMGKCTLHPQHKPLICSLAPVGRKLNIDSGQEQYLFIKPAPDCKGVEVKKENSLTALKEKYKLELMYEYQFFNLLSNLAIKDGTDYNFMLNQIYSYSLKPAFSETWQQIKTTHIKLD